MAEQPTPAQPTPAQDATAAPSSSSPPPFSWEQVALSPESRQLVADRKWENVDMALRSYHNLEKLARVPEEFLVRLPKDNDQKAWDAVYAKLGRPESPEQYAIPIPEGQNDDFAKVAKTWFHESGLSQSQATKLADKWNSYLAEQMKAAETAQAEQHQLSITELKQAWGAEYDANAKIVDRAADAFGMTMEQLAALKQVLGPKDAMQFLYRIGTKIAVEERPVGMSLESQSGQLTPEQAQEQIARLRHDKTFAQLFTSGDPKQRAEARERMERLMKIAYPGETAL